MIDLLVRTVGGSAAGGLVALTSGTNSSTAAGIVIFAVGIVVGAASTYISDRMLQRRIELEHAEWVRAGRPERRRYTR